MEHTQGFIMPRPLLPEEPLKDAVYCAECEIFDQDVIGNKCGSCLSHLIPDSSIPMKCQYFKNDTRLVSILVFLKSGISIYHKAIVKDMANQIEPGLLSAFLQAISSFGEELTNEQVSLITFQKMNIVFCKGKYSNGAMIIKGNIEEEAKEIFSDFVMKLEGTFPNYFDGTLVGKCLPEDEADDIAIECLKEYAKAKFYPISPKVIKKSCKLKCGRK